MKVTTLHAEFPFPTSPLYLQCLWIITVRFICIHAPQVKRSSELRTGE